MTKLPTGFSKDAEAISEAMRAELGVRNIDRLDPRQLANHLEVPSVPLSELRHAKTGDDELAESIDLLTGREQGALSGITVFRGTERVVIYNDQHKPARQASDINHELAHGLLLHRPGVALDNRGCRAWDTRIEEEATFLAGALLVPGKAARWLAKRGMSVEEAATRFGCSVDMINWRLNQSGARRLMPQAHRGRG